MLFNSDFNIDKIQWQSVGFRCWYKTLQSLNGNINTTDLCFLGGDRRRAVIEFLKMGNSEPLLDLCTYVQSQTSGTKGFFAYLLTPAIREENWPELEGNKPKAACIGKEIMVSGWNSDRSNQHPRPILKLIPAGSIFFYEWGENNTDDGKRKRIIQNNWLKPFSEKYKNSGFGRILIGVWR